MVNSSGGRLCHALALPSHVKDTREEKWSKKKEKNEIAFLKEVSRVKAIRQAKTCVALLKLPQQRMIVCVCVCVCVCVRESK